MAAQVGRGRRLPVPGRAVRAEILLPRDVPVPFRPDSHGARAGVHDRRPARALQADAGVPGASPDRLGRVRAAGRKRRAPARDAPGEVDVGEHRVHAGAAEGDGDLLRLGPRVRHLFPGILQVGAALLPLDAAGRARVPQARHAQLVRRVPDRPGQRAGEPRRDVLHPRPHAGDAEGARPVVHRHHEVRRGAALGAQGARGAVAGEHPRDAAQLDRPQRGGGDPLPPRRGGAATSRCSRRGPTRSSAPPS